MLSLDDISKKDAKTKLIIIVNEVAKIIEQANGCKIVTERKLQQTSQSLWVNVPKGIVEFTQLQKGDSVKFIFTPQVSDEIILIKIIRGSSK